MSNIKDSAKTWFKWWIEQRQKKLKDQLDDTMTINPFLMPFLFDFHGFKSLDDLIEFIVGSHLMIGHNTGFGKLIDEKILPEVFGTTKLDRTYRNANPPFDNSAFDEIDHLIKRTDGKMDLISLKAGKWTIQLTMAVQLNHSFSDIIQYYSSISESIIVGVFYGTNADLTDKYDILRGINRGANHHVKDITNYVTVLTGKEFWNWLGDGSDIQEQLLGGFIDALKESNIVSKNKKMLEDYKMCISNKYLSVIQEPAGFNWYNLLDSINS